MSRVLKTVITLLAIAALATPVLAADFEVGGYKLSIYGSVRLATFYTDYDDADDTDFTAELQGNSRFGLSVAKGALSGTVEVGLTDDYSDYSRLVYGVYTFDGGSLLVGKTYTPWSFFMYSVADEDRGGIGYGATYDDRRPMIKLNLDNGFYILAMENDQSEKGLADSKDTFIPELGIGYAGKAGNFSYGVNLAYSSFETAAEEERIDSYLATFNGTLVFNPVTVYFNIGYGQNPYEMGIDDSDYDESVTEHLTATVDEDTSLLTGFVQVAYQVNDTHTIYTGFGYAQEENDDYVDDETRMTYFINDYITIVPRFTVVPELAVFDHMDNGDGSDGEKEVWAGAKWQFDF